MKKNTNDSLGKNKKIKKGKYFEAITTLSLSILFAFVVLVGTQSIMGAKTTTITENKAEKYYYDGKYDEAINEYMEMQKKEINVIKQYPASCMVIGDEFKIEEVCTNYISNAMNHVNGDMRICVTLEEQEDTVKITVANTGDPIPEDSLDKVWIKFYKVDKARTREYGGSGIGLSIVKAIMDAHKQPFGVYNTAEGVAFWFCLKKAPKEETDVQENENDTGSME